MCMSFLGCHNKWFKNLFFHKFGDQNSEISVLAGLCSGPRGQSVTCLFWRLVVGGMLYGSITPVFASVFTCSSPLSHLFHVTSSLDFLLKGHLSLGLEPPPTRYFRMISS